MEEEDDEDFAKLLSNNLIPGKKSDCNKDNKETSEDTMSETSSDTSVMNINSDNQDIENQEILFTDEAFRQMFQDNKPEFDDLDFGSFGTSH